MTEVVVLRQRFFCLTNTDFVSIEHSIRHPLDSQRKTT